MNRKNTYTIKILDKFQNQIVFEETYKTENRRKILNNIYWAGKMAQ